MQPSLTMIEAALAGMTHVLDLEPDDRVLVISDEATRRCGLAFLQAAADLGCVVEHYRLPEDHRPLKAMPADMAPLPGEATVVINAIVGDEREIPFRLEWLHKLEAAPNLRLGHSPGITDEMMEAGPLNVDYAAMGHRKDRLLAAFAGAVSVHITTRAGTDLRLDLNGREMVHDLKSKPGAGANLPCGEVFCCPVEDGADGTLIIDGCYGTQGVVPAPVRMIVEKGRVTHVMCDDTATLAKVGNLLDTDQGARTIAELGIGLNEGARLCDNMLEAEKALRTAHIAFGSNMGMPGGCNDSQTHIDHLFHKPTMVVTSVAGVEKTVLEEGELVD